MVKFGHAVKKLWIFGTFLVGGGDIMYYFWFVMILCITIYVGGLGPFRSARRLPMQGM